MSCIAGTTSNEPGDPTQFSGFGGGWTSYQKFEDGQEVGTVGPDHNLRCFVDAAFTTLCDFGNTTSGYFRFDALAGYEYSLVLKDGGDPQWAAFLLQQDADGGVYSGRWSIQGGGAISHISLYDRLTTPPDGPTPDNQGQTPVPEPASLLLLGSGLAVAGSRFRRRKQAQKA